MPTIFFLFFAEEAPVAQVSPVVIWTPIIVAILSIIGNVVQILMARNKSKSEVSNLDAQTLKSYVDTIKEIQTTNNNLFQTMVSVRDRAEQLETDLEEAREHLQECRKQMDECDDCRETLKSIALALQDIEPFLSSIEIADESVEKIRTISKQILEKVK